MDGETHRGSTEVPADRNPDHPNLMRPWKPGETGNPSGRQPREVRLRVLMLRVGAEELPVAGESGKKMTRNEFAVRYLWNRLADKNVSLKLKLEIIRFLTEHTEGRPFTAEPPQAEESPDELIAQLRKIHESCGLGSLDDALNGQTD